MIWLFHVSDMTDMEFFMTNETDKCFYCFSCIPTLQLEVKVQYMINAGTHAIITKNQ